MSVIAFSMRFALLILGLFIPSVFSQEDQCDPLPLFPILLGAKTMNSTYATAMDYNYATSRLITAGYSYESDFCGNTNNFACSFVSMIENFDIKWSMTFDGQLPSE